MNKKQRPAEVKGITPKFTTGCGSIFITVNFDDEGRPFEVFANLGKAGGCASAQTEAIGRLVSLALRYGIPTGEIIQEIKSISCHVPSGIGPSKIWSCADAVATALLRYSNGSSVGHVDLAETPVGNLGPPDPPPDCIQVTYDPRSDEPCAANEVGGCPECGSSVGLRRQEGCLACSCGWTRCG